MTTATTTQHVEIHGPTEGRHRDILTPEALAFVARLHRHFNARRQELLAEREKRQQALDAGERPDFPPATRHIRDGDWKVAPVPEDLQDRRVEITGPVDRKMMINALNSGAKAFMADFEDSLSPTWTNVLDGQVNLLDAHRGTLRLETPDKTYAVGDDPAALLVRPRGWHLPEKHLLIEGEPASASLVDFGLYFFHNARQRVADGKGIWLYLPKLESHLEARLWNDVFNFAEDDLEVPRGTVKATVLIENILAAFEMEEILYELRDHSAGLNAGRWDYIFSVIKRFRGDPTFVLPDRGEVTMGVPFMRAYTELLVKTCHKRGAHAMGGMAAFIPNRRDPEVTDKALAKVREDKKREATAGFDGTWVAHPDLVAVAKEEFDAVLGDAPDQVTRQRDDVTVTARDLLDTTIEGGSMTEDGVRQNVAVGILYIESWLRGTGAAALFNLMEDAATAEISRSQVWQWVHHGVTLADGRRVDAEFVRTVIDEEVAKIRKSLGDDAFRSRPFDAARALFEHVALTKDFVDFLTLPAYERFD